MASDSERFDEALAGILELAGEGQELYKGYLGVLEWLQQQQDATRDAARAAVGKQLHLGYHWNKSPAITAFRKTQRALLLILATRYAGDGMKAAKSLEPGSDPVTARRGLVTQLKILCNRIAVAHGGIKVDPLVYRHAVVREFPNIALTLRRGRDDGATMLREAFAYVHGGGDAGGHYARWFGTAPRSGVATSLQRVLDAYMHKSIMIKLGMGSETQVREDYGSAAKQAYDEFISRTCIEIALGEHFYGRTDNHSSQIMHDPASYADILKVHMDLKSRVKTAEGNFFVRLKAGDDADALDAELNRIRAEVEPLVATNLARIRKPGGDEKISVAGVIVHEACHQVIDADDVDMDNGVKAYGPDLCHWLAQYRAADAARNADNYRIFCEQFLPGARALVPTL
jgi:hypothetical protein